MRRPQIQGSKTWIGDIRSHRKQTTMLGGIDILCGK